MPHMSELQRGVAFAGLHTIPQAPQLPTLMSVLVSQPFVTSPSQSANPPLHAMWQAEPTHEGMPLALEHAVVQEPQCAGSTAVWISQPLAALPSQLVYPGSQAEMVQAPCVHAG